MNRSILIVICDFLLVSLLAFSTVDVNHLTQPATPRAISATPTATPVTARQDLGDVMRQALDEEKKQHDQLLGELERERATVNQKEAQIQGVRTQLESKEQLAAQLAEARAKLAQEHTNLQQQFAAAQTNLAALNEQLHASTVETVISKEERAAMEAEARKQAEKAAALQEQLAQLQKTNQAMLGDQQSLETQLQLSQASNHYAVAQLSQLQDEVESQRRENARLSDGVKVLAAKSSELASEIHDNRQLTPNIIFEDMSTNRVLASFTGVRSGVFGQDSSKDRKARIILVSDQTNVFALGHVEDTPLTLWSPGTQWEELKGTLGHNAASVPIESLSFSLMDPRVVLIPVSAAQAAALRCKIYRLPKDPYVFQDAVVVGTRGDYYGECKFQIDVTTLGYLKMDRNSIEGLFGKFNPSSGDIVLSKQGEFLGVMANNSYCAVIRNFSPAATFRFGPAGRNQPTAQTLATLYAAVAALPFKLQ